MEDSKNLTVFIILSIGIVLGWGVMFPPPKRVKPPTQKVKKSGTKATKRPPTSPAARPAIPVPDR